MLSLVNRLDKRNFRPRCYIVGKTDSLGVAKAAAAEMNTEVGVV